MSHAGAGMMEQAEAQTNKISGYLDRLGEGFEVLGWAWNPEDPAQRLDIEVAVNGIVAGRTRADLLRGDVAEAGLGDGCYGFVWQLDVPVLPQAAEEVVITARDLASGAALGHELRLDAAALAGRLMEAAAMRDGEGRLHAMRMAARLAPAEPWYVMNLAETLRGAGHADEAAERLQGLLSAQPSFWHAHVALGHIARDRGDHEAALAWLEQAARMAPNEISRWLDIAEALRALGRIGPSMEMLDRAAEIDPGHWAVALGRGHGARAQGEHDLARKHFQEAVRLAPDELAPRLALIDALRDAGALEEARAAGTALLSSHPGRVPVLVGLAYTERQAGEAQQAAHWFTEALALEPENPTLLAELARQDYLLGRQAESNAHLRRALALAPTHTDAVSQLAGQALTVGDAAQAYQIYEEAARAKPGEIAFRFGMLDTLAWQGKLDAALEGLQALEQEHGLSPQLQSWRITLLRRTGRMDEALSVARAASLAAPKQFWLWVERFQTELLAGSDAMLQKALLGIPASSRAERGVRRRCVGALAESLWQMEAALAHYEAAAELSPNDASLQEALCRVKLMRFDLEGARAHLRRHYALIAAERRLRGESLNISQSLLGQMIEEYALDAELAGRLAALNALPLPERLEPCAALVREAPESTAPAASLLLALRQAERLDFAPVRGATAIPQVINAFWHETTLPADLEVMMQGWRARNPGFAWRRFDDVQARDYLAGKFPQPVLQAYLRAKEKPQKADIFRLALLVEEGGIYVDADDRALAPLSRILPAGAELVLAQEEFGCAANHFIAAVPGHPLLRNALHALVNAINRGDNEIPWLLSGPALLTRTLGLRVAEAGGLPPGILLLERRVLGRHVAAGCFAAYKNFDMRNRRRIDAAAEPG